MRYVCLLMAALAVAPGVHWASAQEDAATPPILENAYYVDLSRGEDSSGTGYGTFELPFATLRYAVEQAKLALEAKQASEWNVYLIGGYTYSLEGNPLVLTSGIYLLGWNQPVISLEEWRTYIAMGGGTKIQDIDFVFNYGNEGEKQEGYLSTAVAMIGMSVFDTVELRNCWFYGNYGLGDLTTAVFVGGFNWNVGRAVISNCLFDKTPYGVVTLLSGINITRCTFYCTRADVRILNTDNWFEVPQQEEIPAAAGEEKISGFSTPMLGDSNDIEDTGLNNFEGSGKAVQNDTGSGVDAENNYWGTDDPDEIGGRVDGEGDVNTDSYLEKSIGPGVVIIKLADGGNDVPDAANPVCTVNGQPAIREPASKNFRADNVPQGNVSVSARADGYNNASTTVAVASQQVTSKQINMTKTGGSGGGCGGKNGAVAYACCGLTLFGLGRRHRRNRRTRKMS